MLNRTYIINYLIKKNNYNSYLEIGLAEGINYSLVDCEFKESIDPYICEDHKKYDLSFEKDIPEDIKCLLTYRMTSDEFFKQNTKNYDIVFIDGLHTEEQVGKDIINSLKILNKGGVVVVHDCIPVSYESQIVPRKLITWNGDVWKAICELKEQGIDLCVVDVDYGVGIIKYTDKNLYYPKKSEKIYKDFIQNKNKWMNIISDIDFLKMF